MLAESGRTNELDAFATVLANLVADRVEPDAQAADREARLPHGLVDALAKADLLSVGIPAEAGGSGADTVTALLVVEVLSRSLAAAALPVLAVHACAAALVAAGDHGRVAELVAGGLRAALVDGWSSGVRARLSAVDGVVPRVDDAAECDAFLVTARDDEDNPVALWMARDAPGIEVAPAARRTGLRGMPSQVIRFSGCPQGAAVVVGGSDAVAAARHWFLLGTAAQALGVAGRALLDSSLYLPERRQFGTTLDRMPVLRAMVGRSAAQVTAAAAQVTAAAAAPGALRPEGAAACHAAAWSAVSAAVAVGLDAVQLHGGYGCVTGTAVERSLRDALTLRARVGLPAAEQAVAHAWLSC